MSLSSAPDALGPGISRRDFLLGSIACALALAGCGDSTSSQTPDWLAAACADCEAAARFGRAYLKAHPGEADPALLQGAIAEVLGAARSAQDTPFQRLERAVRAEYARDDTVLVERWILSRTEARLYALAAVGAGER